MIDRKEEEEADEEADRTGLGSGKELSREDFIVRKVSFVSSSSSCMNINQSSRKNNEIHTHKKKCIYIYLRGGRIDPEGRSERARTL